jgi:hypothetical protein
MTSRVKRIGKTSVDANPGAVCSPSGTNCRDKDLLRVTWRDV